VRGHAVATKSTTPPNGPTRVPRLMTEVRGTEPMPFATHRELYAPPFAPNRHNSTHVIDAVLAAGLRGRGGAAFPTGVKMRTVRQGKRTPVVVVNGSEGEPASGKDKLLLTRVPHLVIDGALQAATAVGADEVVICIDRHAQRAIDAVAHALSERAPYEPSVAVRILTVPARYVAGEESALVHLVNGGEAKPTATPPRVFEKGVGGRPTLVDNVETLAHVAQILQWGPEWFRSAGTQEEPGTMLVTVSGDVVKPGVFEVPIGTSMASVLSALGGTRHEMAAMLIGGYYGTWLSGSAAREAVLTNAYLKPRGAALGCGAMIVVPHEACGVRETARLLRWYASETAGQCGPCVHGLPALAGAVEAMADGRARPDTLSLLHRWAGQIEGRGGCRFPDGAVRLLRSALDVFSDDVAAHMYGRPCRYHRSSQMMKIPVVDGQPWK
jgi:NADH:ubiquinone oxidoreductase subunit F (NADH-binding)